MLARVLLVLAVVLLEVSEFFCFILTLTLDFEGGGDGHEQDNELRTNSITETSTCDTNFRYFQDIGNAANGDCPIGIYTTYSHV